METLSCRNIPLLNVRDTVKISSSHPQSRPPWANSTGNIYARLFVLVLALPTPLRSLSPKTGETFWIYTVSHRH